MKKESQKVKLTANEINRYIYCPYQWYYGKKYGQKVLKEKQKALAHPSPARESHFKKGLRFHHHYYRAYRIKRLLQGIGIIAILLVILGRVLGWW